MDCFSYPAKNNEFHLVLPITINILWYIDPLVAAPIDRTPQGCGAELGVARGLGTS